MATFDNSLVCHRILQTIDNAVLHRFWVTDIRPEIQKTKLTAEILTALDNSTAISSLISVRALDDFFRGARREPDDFTVKDLPFSTSNAAFLSATERKSINKHIVHLTNLQMIQNREKYDYRSFLRRLIPQARSLCAAISREPGLDASAPQQSLKAISIKM